VKKRKERKLKKIFWVLDLEELDLGGDLSDEEAVSGSGGGENENQKESEKEHWTLTMEDLYDVKGFELMDTNFVGIQCEFLPKKSRWVPLPSSMEEFGRRNSLRREVTPEELSEELPHKEVTETENDASKDQEETENDASKNQEGSK